MTVISACILSRQKPLLARQFVEISKVRIEGLMNAFLKLVENAGAGDHTYVESDCVRYVYQPLESLYLVLLTTKKSNILEDLQTLRVFATIVQDACSSAGLSGGVNVEEVVLENAFSIIFMLDELISFGLREAVTLAQIRTYTDMDSHEEKLQRIITEGKEKEEKERRRQIAQRLDKERAANKNKQPGGSPSSDVAAFLPPTSSAKNGVMGGLAAAAAGYIQMYGGSPEMVGTLSQQAGQTSTNFANTSSAAAGGGGANSGFRVPGKGMQLGPQRHPLPSSQQPHLQQPSSTGVMAPASSLLGAGEAARFSGGQVGPMVGKMPRSGENNNDDATNALLAAAGGGGGNAAGTAGGSAVVVNPLVEPVHVHIEEKVKATLQAEGGIDEVDVQGTFFVTVTDPNKGGLAAFRISPEDKRFKTKVHPNINRGSYTNNILELRDSTRAYTPNTPAAILKWRLQTKDEDYCPLSISCWPSIGNGGVTLTIEVEATDATRVLEDVHFSFTCPSHVSHQIVRVEGGEVQYDGISLHWRLPQMSANGGDTSTATLEFFAATDVNTVLPFSVEMYSTTNLCELEVEECFHMEKKEPIVYAVSRRTDYMLTVRA